MKDVQAVLRHKEEQAEQVRREIQALYIVIPLLMDDQSTSDGIDVLQLRFRVDEQLAGNGITDLETYYPFVRHQRLGTSST